jgi:hypothetical protein
MFRPCRLGESVSNLQQRSDESSQCHPSSRHELRNEDNGRDQGIAAEEGQVFWAHFKFVWSCSQNDAQRFVAFEFPEAQANAAGESQDGADRERTHHHSRGEGISDCCGKEEERSQHQKTELILDDHEPVLDFGTHTVC